MLRVVSRAEMRAHRLRHRCTYVAVLTTDDRVVVHRRASWKDVWPDRWDLAFGGVLGVGEAWVDGAARELAEEAGIEMAPTHLRDLGGSTYDDEAVSVLGRAFACTWDGPLACPDGEVTEVSTVPRAELGRWVQEHTTCPDSVALVLPALRALGPD